MSTGDIHRIRKEFHVATSDHEKASMLYASLLKLDPKPNTLQYAYLGATEALLAKYSFNPITKLRYLNSACQKLNQSIASNPTNIEIRYMRFSIEVNVPSYLGYSKHINEDKGILIKGLSTTSITKENCEMYAIFAHGIINSGSCNNDEKKLLSKVVTTCNQIKPLKS